jgi:hypothetical protein
LFALQRIITQINWGLGVNYTLICCLNRGKNNNNNKKGFKVNCQQQRFTEVKIVILKHL